MKSIQYILLSVAFFISATLSAQPLNLDLKAPLPVDSKTLKGKLENGFTYYIRKNTVPDKKVELRLVINAGSILETDAQRGLSHFLEHMSFSGSKSFPNDEMIKTLESVDVRFGKDLNVYTSFDETVYFLPIASDKVEIGLTALEDLAMNLTLSDQEIDRKRDAVLKEMQSENGAANRVREKYMSVLFAGSLYPDRLPTGKEEVIRKFTPKELRDYYKKWHRPDMMAVIAVGDLDPQEIKRLIIEKFGSYPAAKETEQRPSIPVPDHNDIKVVVATDSEISGGSVGIYYKHKPQRVTNLQTYIEYNISNSLYSSMMNARLNDLSETDEPPFAEAASSYSTYFRQVDTYSSNANCTPTGVLTAFKALITENERMRRYGFTPFELEQAKKKLLTRLQKRVKDRDKTRSDVYADEYQVNFLIGEPIPGIEYEMKILQNCLPKINLKQINNLAEKYMTEQNRVVVVTGPGNDSIVYPKESEFIEAINSMKNVNIKLNAEVQIATRFMTKIPKAGKIIATKEFPETGLIEWKLSNGSTVVLKPAKLKNDQILFRSNSNGGYSMFDQKDDMSAIYATRIQDESGVNGIYTVQLKNLLEGKEISLSQSLALYNESMSGKYGVKDAESFFQLLHLYHTAPYFDKKGFNRLMKKEYTKYADFLNNPSTYFGYQIEQVLANGNKRRNRWPIKENLDQVNFDRAAQIYKSRFGNAAGFTYVFVGDINPETIKPLVLTYLASIPGDSNTKTGYKEENFTSPLGPRSFEYKKGMDKKAAVSLKFVKQAVWNDEKANSYDAFLNILNTRLFESLRQEMSDVYGVRVTGGVNRNHEQEAKLNITFVSNPELYNKLYERTIKEICKLIDEGPTSKEITRIKEKARAVLDDQIKDNSTWLPEILYAYRLGFQVKSVEQRKNEIESLNIESVKAAAKEYIDHDKCLKFVLLPE